MEILGRSATVLGARLANVRVSIPAMKAPRVVLMVNGQADGPSRSRRGACEQEEAKNKA